MFAVYVVRLFWKSYKIQTSDITLRCAKTRSDLEKVVYQHRYYIQNVFRMYSGLKNFIQEYRLFRLLITFLTYMLYTPSSERADSR
jgi:ribosome-interacting GTPase 1